QDAGALGAARCALPRLCQRLRAARRLPPAGHAMMDEEQIPAPPPVRRERYMTVSAESRPVMPRHARLKFDETRGVWVLLVPERVLVPDETAVEVLQLCDGVRTVDT